MRNGTTVLPAVVGILLLLALALSGLQWWMQRASTSNCHNKVPTDIGSLQFAAERFARDHDGRWPSALEDLVRPEAGLGGKTYLKDTRLPKDPWGQPYFFEPALTPGSTPRIFTLGRDGEPGGAGDDADFDESMLWNGDSPDGADQPR